MASSLSLFLALSIRPRFLQGWDAEDMRTGAGDAETEKEPGKSGSSAVRRRRHPLGTALPVRQPPASVSGIVGQPLPHRTVLPMLQFSLAGIIGKPDTFFNVPAVRFAFEFLQFL